jgi:prevent-host-death family protein
MDPRSNTVGCYDARTQFSKLLKRVESGESFTITRHGTPVAKMIPICAKYKRADRRAAIKAIRRLATKNSLDGINRKGLIAEGRR